ncbi:hypothetical protein N7465_007624 [Penicillium sp. CMV-2018d]|nr:hypothetical protein N7465_007624 [Penicillium sp. CMV-2018d]
MKSTSSAGPTARPKSSSRFSPVAVTFKGDKERVASDVELAPLFSNPDDLGAMGFVVLPFPLFDTDFWPGPIDPQCQADVRIAITRVQPKPDIGVQFRVRF